MCSSALLGFDTTTGERVTLGDEERCSGLYVLGKPGTGKTNLLLNLALRDIKAGHGLFFLDPHGDAINALLAHGEIPRLTDKVLNGSFPGEEKWKRVHFPPFIDASEVWLLDPEKENSAFGINLTYCQNPASLTERVNTYTKAYNVFRKAFAEDWGPWLQLIIQNTLYVFIENQGYTLAETPRFLLDGEFRQKLVSAMQYNPEVVDFWRYRFSQRRERDQEAQVDAALTRFSTFLGHPYVRDIIGQKQTTIAFGKIMEQRKIVLLKLSANLASDIKRFIGTIFISELLHAVRSRREGQRAHFSVFVDEFQNFATADFATLITEGRKFGIATTIAHQERVGQLRENPEVLGATLAAANKVVFQLTVKDAQELAPEFAKKVTEEEGKEAALVISPHAAEDLWDRGHPDPVLMDIRDKYFWFIHLGRRNSPDRFFVFDPENFSGTHETFDFGRYDDWELYRITPEMFRKGLTDLNRFYYRSMSLSSADLAKTIEGRALIISVIRNLGGLFGFYPSMRPFMPDPQRNQLIQAFQEFNSKGFVRLVSGEIGLRHNRRHAYFAETGYPGVPKEQVPKSFKEAWEKSRLPLPGEAFTEKGYLAQKLFDICSRDPYPYNGKAFSGSTPALPRRIGELHWVPKYVASVSDMRDWVQFATTINMPPHLIDSLFDWEALSLSGARLTLLERLIEATVSFSDDQGIFRDIASTFIERFYEPDPQISADLAWQRAFWQTTELVLFMRGLFVLCPFVFARFPLKVPSGQYEQTVKVERTQQDLINEMAKELTDLPRYSASAKLVDGEKSRIHKIRTAQFAKGEFPAFCVLSEQEAYYKSREAVNREIVQRLEGNETQPKRNQPPPSSI